MKMKINKQLSDISVKYMRIISLMLFCITLLIVRIKLTQSLIYFFLLWNLFLAMLPLCITTVIGKKRIKKIFFYILVLIWLLLLPNAPYIITDFIHINKNHSIPQWFDILMLASFAITGLLFGLASMKEMQRIIANRFNRKFSVYFIIIICFSSGYGIYLGRMLRYNSWDILKDPWFLIIDMITSPFNTETYLTAWGMTLGFGVLLYLTFSIYNNHKK